MTDITIAALTAEVERLNKSRNKWGRKYNTLLEKHKVTLSQLKLAVWSDSEECAALTARVADLEAICNQLEAEALYYAIQNKELRDAGQEVLHLSDRKHAAWDRLRAAITKGEREG